MLFLVLFVSNENNVLSLVFSRLIYDSPAFFELNYDKCTFIIDIFKGTITKKAIKYANNFLICVVEFAIKLFIRDC